MPAWNYMSFLKLLNIVEIMEGTNTIRMRYEHCLREVPYQSDKEAVITQSLKLELWSVL